MDCFFWEHSTHAVWLYSSGLGRALTKAKMGAPFVTINSHSRFENYVANLLKSKAFLLLFFIKFHLILYICKILPSYTFESFFLLVQLIFSQ